MKKKYSLAALAAVTILIPMLSLVALAADPNFGNVQFKNTWREQDALVGSAGIDRPYTWGPSVPDAQNAISEPYAESPGGQRLVQYFDKARMELNNPATGLVTAGLIVRDLVAGIRQDGDNVYTTLAPSKTQVAGDPVSVNSNAPVYASFKDVVTLGNPDSKSKPSAIGTPLTQGIDKNGVLSTIVAPETLTIGDFQTETGHNIAKVFQDFKNQRGSITDPVSGATLPDRAVYTDNPTSKVFGFAISEPYWVTTKIAGTDRTVLVQLFQRRVLTYNPALAVGKRVEMGNVGQHYYQWRYVESNGTPTPTTTPTTTTTPPPATPPLDFSQSRAPYLKTGNIPVGGTGNVASYPTGAGAINSSPVYDPATSIAIIATAGNGVVAVNFSNFTSPTQAWQYKPAGVNFNGQVVLYNGYVYLPGSDGKIYSIKASDGTKFWDSTIPGGAIASTVVVDTDTIYFTAADGKLYAINLNNGTPKWQNAPSGTTVNGNYSPVIDAGGLIYVAANDKKVYAFNKDGTQVGTANWTPTALDGQIGFRPSIGNGKVYVGTDNGTLYALNTNGTIQSQRTFTAAKGIFTSPAIVTINGAPRVFVGTDDGRVYGVDANNVASTSNVWTYTVPAVPLVRSSPAVIDGFVYFGAEDKKIYKVEATNQANAVVLATAGSAFAQNAPIVNSGYLLIATSGGVLHVIK